ncbi:NACHT, LRR and PYD domains-containing protein 1b allele 2-like [Seriola lalandi dorsalis]|uniref:NACHT, LRR and PYD domains-containing protein 1b allele 2-like n=1 Tax=Seriola lalandi dorsalis TaxID=1841481 RepID=UPI000C6FA102|nr:NACHT, LRR and PYD domains-containing protein 1b allele 2-like [Seriola lalandi dorsalis]
MSEDGTKLMKPLSSFTPELQPESAKVSYRFRFPGPGGFQCTTTGLVFVLTQEADLHYRTVQWDDSLLQSAGKIPAGPLFKLQCPEDAVCQLHLPHCETKDAKDHLCVVHISDDGMSIIKPLEVTDTHVIIKVPHLSAFGVVRSLEVLWKFLETPDPVNGHVFLYLRPTNPHTQMQYINVHLVSSNVPLEEVTARQSGHVNIPAPSKCKFIEDRNYSVQCLPTAHKIQPKKSEFDLDFGPNYHPTFEIRLSASTQQATIMVQDENNTEVWKQDVDLTGLGPARIPGF